jgi:hypothetical protein
MAPALVVYQCKVEKAEMQELYRCKHHLGHLKEAKCASVLEAVAVDMLGPYRSMLVTVKLGLGVLSVYLQMGPCLSQVVVRLT